MNNRLDDDSNKVKFKLMGFQGTDRHKKLGEKEVHLFNIIKVSVAQISVMMISTSQCQGVFY